MAHTLYQTGTEKLTNTSGLFPHSRQVNQTKCHLVNMRIRLEIVLSHQKNIASSALKLAALAIN